MYSMEIKSTKFKDLKIIQSKNFRDSRGFFKEDFKQVLFKKYKFIFGCISSSKKGVLRGMHMQTKFSQAKYVSVIKGSILDIVVDLRSKSKTFGKHYKVNLSDENAKSIFIPAGFAHGFLGLEKENIIHYFCTNYRSQKHEIGLKWNDKNLNIKWPIKNPTVSAKDKENISFAEYKKKYTKKK